MRTAATPRSSISARIFALRIRVRSRCVGVGCLYDHKFERLEFVVVKTADTNGEGTLRVEAPDHRMDIDGPHDLVEEICRAYRYDRVPSTILSDELPPQRGNPRLEIEERLKDILAHQGLQEVITYRLTTPEAESKARLEPGPEESYVALINPINVDRVVDDGRVLKLIHRMLKAKVVLPDGTRISTEEGAPQGGPLSPILSNIVLDELERMGESGPPCGS